MGVQLACLNILIPNATPRRPTQATTQSAFLLPPGACHIYDHLCTSLPACRVSQRNTGSPPWHGPLVCAEPTTLLYHSVDLYV